MNRISSFFALSAIVIAGAFAGTAAQASAGNVNVAFKVHDADASASMIQVGSPPLTITGLINPAAPISPGGDDPSSGFALFSAGAPSVGGSVSGSVSYANASDGVSNLCTFTIMVSRPATNSYGLRFAVSPSITPCTVPTVSPTNANGQFTSTTYMLTWST